MNKEKIAIYEELIEWAEMHTPDKTEAIDDYTLGKLRVMKLVLFHLKGRIEELKKDV